MPQNIVLEMLDVDGTTVESRSHLQRSAKRKTVKQLTVDLPASHSHSETPPNVSIGSIDPNVDAGD